MPLPNPPNARRQTTTITDWSTTPAVDRIADLPLREGRYPGRPHFTECLLFSDPSLHCTCDDDSPDWTI